MTDHAALPPAGASLPTPLEKQLQDLQIAQHLRPGAAGPLAQQIQVCLLADAAGTLLVLFPADHLLDLRRLERETGRALEPVRDRQLQAILQPYQATQLPGLPALVGATCLIDRQLRGQDRLWLPSGAAGQWLELDQLTFNRLMTGATDADFAVPLHSIACSAEGAEQDQQDISLAVQNFTALR